MLSYTAWQVFSSGMVMWFYHYVSATRVTMYTLEQITIVTYQSPIGSRPNHVNVSDSSA